MFIYLIGPGGAGKTTTATLLASQLRCDYSDLDEYFMQVEGDISDYINAYGYESYTSRNLELFLELKAKQQLNSIHVIVCSSGFMTYPNHVHGDCIRIKEEIENHPFTFLLLPSLDIEQCVQLILARQMGRSYLKPEVEKEEMKIRTRFKFYTHFSCHRILTNQTPHAVVAEIKAQLDVLLPFIFCKYSDETQS